MHLMIEHRGTKHYYRSKEDMLIAIENSRDGHYRDIGNSLLLYSSAAVGPTGLLIKDRFKGLRNPAMYPELWEYLEYEEVSDG